MKERPILFSGPMVAALLAGTKSQTRRVVRDTDVRDANVCAVPTYVTKRPVKEKGRVIGHRDVIVSCPYGAPGDRLWVREGVAIDYFSATPWLPPEERHGYRADWTGRSEVPEPKWTPSIHMPRWASRITLELTGVRVERLQAISEADAKAEGVAPAPFCKSGRAAGLEHVEAFEDIWASINGAESWAPNPWVWVLQFRRCT